MAGEVPLQPELLPRSHIRQIAHHRHKPIQPNPRQAFAGFENRTQTQDSVTVFCVGIGDAFNSAGKRGHRKSITEIQPSTGMIIAPAIQ